MVSLLPWIMYTGHVKSRTRSTFGNRSPRGVKPTSSTTRITDRNGLCNTTPPGAMEKEEEEEDGLRLPPPEEDVDRRSSVADGSSSRLSTMTELHMSV